MMFREPINASIPASDREDEVSMTLREIRPNSISEMGEALLQQRNQAANNLYSKRATLKYIAMLKPSIPRNKADININDETNNYSTEDFSKVHTVNLRVSFEH
ncbi:MAG: hypothetical protein AAGA18_13945 [Verrucomicrobiota bacterium]